MNKLYFRKWSSHKIEKVIFNTLCFLNEVSVSSLIINGRKDIKESYILAYLLPINKNVLKNVKLKNDAIY